MKKSNIAPGSLCTLKQAELYSYSEPRNVLAIVISVEPVGYYENLSGISNYGIFSKRIIFIIEGKIISIIATQNLRSMANLEFHSLKVLI